MRLWTVQSEAWLNKLRDEGEIECKADMIPDRFYLPAYVWMSNQMKRRLGEKYAAEYPIWAWAVFDGKNKRPNLRRMEFRSREYPSVLVEIEVPSDQVLLSDEEGWNGVMSDIFNRNDNSDWEDIFLLRYPDGTVPKYIQACFGHLDLDQVMSIKIFGKRDAGQRQNQ